MGQFSSSLFERFYRSALSLVASIAFVASAAAQSDPVYAQPLYSPDAKSYFELLSVTPEQRRLSLRNAQEVSWEVANSLAAQHVFKGTKGRLAVVTNIKVYEFLAEKFRPAYPAWIGAAYYCKTRQLRWSDGHLQARGDFQAWHPQWDQAGAAGCVHGGGNKAGYMPIVCTSVGEGFRWVAKGAKKEYKYYFVEYPTGAP